MDGCSRSLAEDTGLMSCPALAHPGPPQGPANACTQHTAPLRRGTGTGQSHEGRWETPAQRRGIAHVPSHPSQSKAPRGHTSAIPAARTSSGGCRTFCRYFFSTSSGVLPVGEQESEGLEGSMGETHC